MYSIKSVLILIWACAAFAIEWPVFFEHLGYVHSIHNKWDLTLRVHIDLPALQARTFKVLHRLDLLNGDFHDPDELDTTSKRSTPSRLDELNESWSQQNKHIRRRCENIKRRAGDLVELGEHTLYRRRRKRQINTEGVLKAVLGLAYHDDVKGMESKVDAINTKLSGDLNKVRSQTNTLKSRTNEMMTRQSSEIKKMESLAGRLQRKVSS